jgi:cob(I)alamin adenosyltransferase
LGGCREWDVRLYTKTGDDGKTGLFGGGRVSKAAPRVRAYGEVDELNSALGVARTLEPWVSLDASLVRIQSELFDLGATLATPPDSPHAASVPTVDAASIARLEREIDAADGVCKPLQTFILPGGTKLAAWLHFSRCVCRRAEREVVALAELEPVDGNAVIYLNRLSDLLFALGREANARAGVAEPAWIGRERRGGRADGSGGGG